MDEDYWFEDLFPQTWQDVVEVLKFTLTSSRNYSHGHAERIREMYWRFLEER